MGVKVKEKVAGSGVFWIFINHKGKRKSKCVGSEKAALEVKSIIEARLKIGQPLPEEEQPAPRLSAYFEKFNQNYLQTALRHSAKLRHQSNFNIHILPTLEHLRLDEITRE
jgi:integrase